MSEGKHLFIYYFYKEIVKEEVIFQKSSEHLS